MLKRALTDDSEEREPQSPSISLVELIRNESNSISIIAVQADIDDSPSPPVELVEDILNVKEMTVEELMCEFNTRSSHHAAHHVSVTEVIDQLVLLLYGTHRYLEVESFLKLQLCSSKNLRGPADKKTLAITGFLINTLLMNSKYREASLLLKTWITANSKTYGVDHVETLAAKRYHAVCLGKLGKDEEAAVVFKEILNSLERIQEPNLLHQYKTSKSLSDILMKMDSFQEAEGVFESILKIGKTLYDPYSKGLKSECEYNNAMLCHNRTGFNLMDARTLASIKYRLGKLNAAEALYRWSLKGFEEILGPSHSETLELLITFADLLFEIYRQNVSKVGMNSFPSGPKCLLAVSDLYHRIVGIEEEIYGEKCAESFSATVKMAESLGMQKNYEESENAYKSALYIAENAHGFSQFDAISTMNSLANIMLEQVGSDFTESNREKIEFISDLLVKVISGFKKILGPVHPDTMQSIRTLSLIHATQGLNHEALELLERALNACARSLGKDDPRSLCLAFETAKMQLKIGDTISAEDLLKRVVNWRKMNLGVRHADTLHALRELGSVYTARRKYSEARTIYQEALTGCEKSFGERHFETRNTMKLFIKLFFKIPDIPAAVGMIHLSVKRTVAACGTLDTETTEITELYVKELIDLEQFTDADVVYMKLYNSTVSEHGQNNINSANLALKIGHLHYELTGNYSLASVMFQRAAISYTECLGANHECTIEAETYLKYSEENIKNKTKK